MTDDTICPLHGDYSDPTGRYRRWECPQCQREAQRVESDWRAHWRAYEWWLNQAGIPRRYRNRTVRNWKPDGQDKSVVDLVNCYIDTLIGRFEAGDGLTLLGPPGIGKTHLLIGVISKACGHGIQAMYAVWPDLIEARRQSFNASADDPQRRALDDAATVPLLALDEIGLGSGTEWERSQLFELIDYRYREELATCVASNARDAGLTKVVGERLADRLGEMSATAVLRGNSKRGSIRIDDGPALEPPPDQITVTECHGSETRERTITHQPHVRYLS